MKTQKSKQISETKHVRLCTKILTHGCIFVYVWTFVSLSSLSIEAKLKSKHNPRQYK